MGNGTMDPPVLDENNINTQDSTWTIPDGIWSYPHGEMGDYGPRYMTQYTCSKLQFGEQEVMQMASKQAFDECDYTEALSMGTTSATNACVIISPKDDLTAEGEMEYYASAVKDHCLAGQKIAVTVGDHDSQASSCGSIARHI